MTEETEIKYLLAVFIFIYMWGSASIMMLQYNEINDLHKQIEQLQGAN